VKLHAALNWLNDTFRPTHVQSADGHEPGVDKTTALTTMHVSNPMGALGMEPVPPGYVPSQQDERPQ
jgi:hypothetical protein